MRADLQRLKRDTDSGRSSSPSLYPSGSTIRLRIGQRWRDQHFQCCGHFQTESVLDGKLGRPRAAAWLFSSLPSSYMFDLDHSLSPKYLATSRSLTTAIPKYLVGTDGARLYLTEFGSVGPPSHKYPVPAGRWRPSQYRRPRCRCSGFPPMGQRCWWQTRWARQHFTDPFGLLPVLGGSPRRLGDAAAQAAAWSSDGQRIVYADGHDLWLIKSDGSESHKLFPRPIKLLSLSGRRMAP